jgi:hypothetical protein
MENWKVIEGFEAYEVSDLGRVRRAIKGRTVKAGGILKQYKTGSRTALASNKHYLRVVLCKNGKTKGILVHRLVAKEFIPNPKNLPQVNHKDGIKINNSVTNLEWRSRRGDRIHAMQHGLTTRKGIFNKKTKRWEVRVTLEKGKRIRMGSFTTKEEAQKTYAAAVGSIIKVP